MYRLLKLALAFAIIATLAGAIPAAAGDTSRTTVHRFDDASVIDGSYSKLERDDDEVELKLKARELMPGGAYTIWWVVFNTPDGCVDGCGLDDLFNPDATVSLLWATGGIANAVGVHRFEAELEEGNPPGQVLFGPGLMDAEGAEIHPVVRGHGLASADPDVLEQQLTTFEGGCDVNVCVDEQFAIHPPMADDD